MNQDRDIVIRINRKWFVVVGAVIFLGAAAGQLWSESLTLVTTYPAPSGIYNQLVTTGNGALNTTLNRNAGNTVLVPWGGKVGIGTASPGAALDVVGNVRASGNVTALRVLNPVYAP